MVHIRTLKKTIISMQQTKKRTSAKYVYRILMFTNTLQLFMSMHFLKNSQNETDKCTDVKIIQRDSKRWI